MAEPLPLRSRRWASALVVATVALQPVQAQPSWQPVPPQQRPGGEPAAGLPQWQRITPVDSIPGGRQGTPIWQTLPGTPGLSRQLVWEPVAPVTAESKPGLPSPGAKPGSALPQTWTQTTAADPRLGGSESQVKPMARPPTSPAEAQALLDGLKPTAADFSPQLRLGEAVPTAQQLSEQQSQLSFFQLAPLGGAKQGGGGGTGNQNYAARLDAGLTDHIQISAFYSVADDPLYAPITGKTIQPANFWQSYGGALQWRLLGSNTTAWTLALAGSLEAWTVGSGGCDSFSCKGQNNASQNIFNNSGSRVQTTNVVGSLSLPISWQALPTLALTFTPGVSFLPSSQGAGQGGSGPFYGTNASVAAGASWRPIPSLTLFGSGLIPLGPGNNSFNGNLVFARVPILTTGINWALNPRIALEGQLTNGWGATPATAMLTLPSENQLGYSGRFIFTPGALDTPQPALTPRQQSLALGGLTVNTALVPPSGTTELWANGDNEGNGFGYIGYSLSNSFQLDVYKGGVFNNVEPTNTLATTYASDGGWNYRFGGKAIVMSQLRGAPFSLGGRISLGRNTDPSSYQGYVFAESVSTWEANSWLAFNLNPKLAWSGISTPWAVGVSANIQLGRHFQLIPEVNVVGSEINATNGTLALRWLTTTSTNLEIYVSNAAGLFDIGQLLDNSNMRVGGRLLFSF